MKKAVKTLSALITLCALIACNPVESQFADILQEDAILINSSLKGSEVHDIERTIVSRVNNATRSSELISDAEAKSLFTPLVEDGKKIKEQISRLADVGSLKMTTVDREYLDDLDEVSLAGLSYEMFTIMEALNVKEIQIVQESSLEKATVKKDENTESRFWPCLKEAFGFRVIGEVKAYVNGTKALVSASELWPIIKAAGTRWLGWAGLAYSVYQFVDCISE